MPQQVLHSARICPLTIGFFHALGHMIAPVFEIVLQIATTDAAASIHLFAGYRCADNAGNRYFVSLGIMLPDILFAFTDANTALLLTLELEVGFVLILHMPFPIVLRFERHHFVSLSTVHTKQSGGSSMSILRWWWRENRTVDGGMGF